MKIAFLGLKESFHYFNIGGAESYVRRIAKFLVEKGMKVDYIMYNSRENKIEVINDKFKLKYFKHFKESLRSIRNERYDHIIKLYIYPVDRIKFAHFRKKMGNLTKFHLIHFSWPDSPIKRNLMFAESRLFPYNGNIFCISKRQYEYVKPWANNAIHLLPPVPDKYFLTPEKKPKNKNIKIIFLGRIDPGKGINEVINVFNTLNGNNKFECYIYGIHKPEDKQSLEIYNWLKRQKVIKYVEVNRQNYTEETEKMVKAVLRKTDIFLQPYKKLSSTIDTPLLLLEAMASLCAVITKQFGNIPDIYGKSKFLIPKKESFEYILNLLKNITYEDIIYERERIYKRNKFLKFRTENIANSFIDSISRCK